MTMSALVGKPAPKGMLADMTRLGPISLRSPRPAPALMDLAWGSVAALAIAPLQDALNLGNEARMNVPGRAEGNWRWRCTEDMVSSYAFEWLRDLTRISDRLQGGS
jgi:4-alpha-glucanotransferase